MSNKDDIRRHYQQLSPKEKARLAFKCVADNTPIPADLLSGMSPKERVAYFTGLSVLSMAHSHAESELGQIENGCREAALIMTNLHRIQWEILILAWLRNLLDRTKEPHTESEYERLVEEAEQAWVPLDEFVETEVFDELDKEGPCALKPTLTNGEYQARFDKKMDERMKLISSGVLEAKLVDGKQLVRLGSWCQVTGEKLLPDFGPALEARVFPDEMAKTVEEMRQERASLRELMVFAFNSVMMSSSDREVRSSPLEFAGIPICPNHPGGDDPAMNHIFPREMLPGHILNWRQRMATLEAVFKRIGDEDFDGVDITEVAMTERLRLVRLMVSELAQQLGIEETAVAPDEKAVEETWRRLTDR